MSSNDNIASFFAPVGGQEGGGQQQRSLFAPSKTAKEDLDLGTIFSDYFLEDWGENGVDMPQTVAPVPSGRKG